MTAICDVTKGTISATQYDDSAVDITQLGNVVNDDIRARGLHLDNHAEEKAREVEVVDCHVPEQPAGSSQILARAGAGSRLTMINCSSRPMSPAAIRSCTS